MLRSLPVPRTVLAAIWVDPDWRKPLENLVLAPTGDGDGGILRAVEDRGLGVVTLDGETVWLKDAELRLPHPILLTELDDWRGILTELGVEQGSAQLFRETFRKPTGDAAKGASVDQFSNGQFDLLATVNNVAKRSSATACPAGAPCAASSRTACRPKPGSSSARGDPMYETQTGDLVWVDAKQQVLALEQVPPRGVLRGQHAHGLGHLREAQDRAEGGSRCLSPPSAPAPASKPAASSPSTADVGMDFPADTVGRPRLHVPGPARPHRRPARPRTPSRAGSTPRCRSCRSR